MTRILFVCEGNICRSAMAEWLANATLPDVRAESAGFRGGEPMTRHSITLMRDLAGIDASSHVSRNVKDVGASEFDMIVAIHPYIAGRLQTEYGITPHLVWDVPDPVGTEIDGFRVTYDQVEAALAGLVDEITRIGTRAEDEWASNSPR
jgi:protein-tyrosine phosphatase